MKLAYKIGGLALASISAMSYTWLAGSEYVEQGRAIPILSAAPLVLVAWLATCYLLASDRRKSVAWWILGSGSCCTLVAAVLLLMGFTEDNVTPFIGGLLFIHVFVMLRNIRKLESRLL